MKIEPWILDFELAFNHYPKSLRWKNRAGPIIGYYRNDEYIRIDMYKKSVLTNEVRFQLTGSIGRRHEVNAVYDRFEEAYEGLVLYMKKNELRFLL